MKTEEKEMKWQKMSSGYKMTGRERERERERIVRLLSNDNSVSFFGSWSVP